MRLIRKARTFCSWKMIARAVSNTPTRCEAPAFASHRRTTASMRGRPCSRGRLTSSSQTCRCREWTGWSSAGGCARSRRRPAFRPSPWLAPPTASIAPRPRPPDSIRCWQCRARRSTFCRKSAARSNARRNLARVQKRCERGHAELVRRIHADFREMAGLLVTSRQGARFWNLSRDLCVPLLDSLVGDGTLARSGQHYRLP